MPVTSTVCRFLGAAALAAGAGCASWPYPDPPTSFAVTHFGPGPVAFPAPQVVAYSKMGKSPFDPTDDTGRAGRGSRPEPVDLPAPEVRTVASLRRAEPVFPAPIGEVEQVGGVQPLAASPPANQQATPGVAKHGPVLDGILSGHKRAGTELDLTDPHCRTNPTAAGCLLNLGPGETAVERAVELARQLEAAETETRTLANRLRALDAVLESRERMLREDEAELTKSAQDLAAARADLLRLRDERDKLRVKLRVVEREDLETLRLVVDALAKYLEGTP